MPSFLGDGVNVALTMSRRSTSRGRADRSRSPNPSEPDSRYRPRHVSTVAVLTPRRCAVTEMAYCNCLGELFGSATSGRAVKDVAIRHRGMWHPDVCVDLPDRRTLYVEYDGSYWHASKVEIDTAKSHDLLATGALAVRLREHPLPGLYIDKRRYLEVVVHAVAPAVDEVVEQIAAWVNTA